MNFYGLFWTKDNWHQPKTTKYWLDVITLGPKWPRKEGASMLNLNQGRPYIGLLFCFIGISSFSNLRRYIWRSSESLSIQTFFNLLKFLVKCIKVLLSFVFCLKSTFLVKCIKVLLNFVFCLQSTFFFLSKVLTVSTTFYKCFKTIIWVNIF